MSEQARCWIDGDILPASEARVSVFDHGFLYGDGVFEGVRFRNRTPFRLDRHLRRLRDSAAALLIRVPLSAGQLARAVAETIAASPLDAGYLRIIITRGVGPLGIDPASCGRPGVIVIADELDMLAESRRVEGVKVIIASTRRMTADRLDPRIKSLNYLNAILARIEANQAGADEAILLNHAGRVAEGSADNLFIVKDGELKTPAVSEGALAGITRATVLELAGEKGMPVRETLMTPYDLYTADECFLTGTGARLIAVREIDGRPLASCPGEAYRGLAAAYAALVAKETAAKLAPGQADRVVT